MQTDLRRACYSLVTVSVLVNIAALRHHGLFVQGKRQFHLKEKNNSHFHIVLHLELTDSIKGKII